MRDVGGRSDETIITGGQRDSDASICETVGMGKICRAGAGEHGPTPRTQWVHSNSANSEEGWWWSSCSV